MKEQKMDSLTPFLKNMDAHEGRKPEKYLFSVELAFRYYYYTLFEDCFEILSFIAASTYVIHSYFMVILRLRMFNETFLKVKFECLSVSRPYETFFGAIKSQNTDILIYVK